VSARVKLLATAEERGWAVHDNGRYASFERAGRRLWVTWSVRGTVTQAGIAGAGPVRGEGKADRVIALLHEEQAEQEMSAEDTTCSNCAEPIPNQQLGGLCRKCFDIEWQEEVDAQ
jgi:hypothetical protein